MTRACKPASTPACRGVRSRSACARGRCGSRRARVTSLRKPACRQETSQLLWGIVPLERRRPLGAAPFCVSATVFRCCCQKTRECVCAQTPLRPSEAIFVTNDALRRPPKRFRTLTTLRHAKSTCKDTHSRPFWQRIPHTPMIRPATSPKTRQTAQPLSPSRSVAPGTVALAPPYSSRPGPVAKSESRYVCVLIPYPALPRFGAVLYAQLTGLDDCGLLRYAPFKRRRIDFPSHSTRSRCNACEPGIKKAPAQHTQGLSATCLRKRWVTDEPRCLPGACRSDQWSRRRKQPGPRRGS